MELFQVMDLRVEPETLLVVKLVVEVAAVGVE
jgi:hypothetical protein